MGTAFAVRVRRFALVGVVLMAGCGAQVQPPTAPRYIVTDGPIDIGVGPGVCVAVDRNDAQGVWWWEPGADGCSTRSTGPDLFRAEGASVIVLNSNPTSAVRFRVATQSTKTPVIDVRLVVGDDEMRSVNSASRVTTHVRRDLKIPEMPIRGRRAG